MKKLLLLTLLISTSFVYSQNEMNLTAQGFEPVIIEANEQSKDALFKRTLVYLKSIYRNPDKVIAVVDNESIVVNAYTDDTNANTELRQYTMWYNINLDFKDGKIKYHPKVVELSESFQGEKSKSITIASDSSIDTVWKFSKSKGDYYLLNEHLKSKLDAWFSSYLTNLKKALNKSDW